MTDVNSVPRVHGFNLTALIGALMFALMIAVPVNGLAEDSFPDTESHETMTLEVNINQDDAEKMADLLEGVGPTRAEAIVEYRQTNGDFGEISDLTNVTGIGPATLEANRDRLVLE